MNKKSLSALLNTNQAFMMSLGMALLLVAAFVVTPRIGWSVAPAQAADLAQSQVSGRVTFPDGRGVSDAQVVALARDGGRTTATTDANGTYTLSLAAGKSLLNIRPLTVTTTSPDWVYASAPRLVNVPVGETVEHFEVQTATVTVSGRLSAPGGEPFVAPHRAWVQINNLEGQGNMVQVMEDGSFTIKTIPGQVLFHGTLENPGWAMPPEIAGLRYYAEDGDHIQVEPDPIVIVTKQGSISGQVTVKDEGAAPAGIPVLAWRVDRADAERTLTDERGRYSIPVISGTWMVRAMPVPNQLYAGDAYLPAEPPHLIRQIGMTGIVTQSLLIARVDTVVRGVTVDAASGERLTDSVHGLVYSSYYDTERARMVRGSAAPVQNGMFLLGVSSSLAPTYTLGLTFPPDVPYTAASRVVVDITDKPIRQVSLPIMTDNSTISGTLRAPDGDAVTGVPGSVRAFSDSGGYVQTQVNPADGMYRMRVAATDVTGKGGSTWVVRAFVDPTTGYIVQRPRQQAVFLPFNAGEGSSATADFTLAQPNATIRGRVFAPGDASTSASEPVAGARVVVQQVTEGGRYGYTRRVVTNRQGSYSVRVPAGDYRVSVHAPHLVNRRLLQGLIAPAPIQVTVADAGQATADDLTFRTSTAVVTGQVLYAGAGHTALVRARSRDGAVVHAQTDADGRYRLGLIGELGWRIVAVSSDGDVFLRSGPQVITPTVQSQPQPGPDLTLQAGVRLPEHQVFFFASDEDQNFVLGDGSQVQVPAGAMGLSDTITLMVQPLPNLESDNDVEPVSFGYRLHAFDSQQRPITHFLQPVTLVISYTNAQLDALGITAEQLVPAYWDEGNESWEPVENVAVLPGEQGGVVTMMVDHFTDYALLAAAEEHDTNDNPTSTERVYLPFVAR